MNYATGHTPRLANFTDSLLGFLFLSKPLLVAALFFFAHLLFRTNSPPLNCLVLLNEFAMLLVQLGLSLSFEFHLLSVAILVSIPAGAILLSPLPALVFFLTLGLAICRLLVSLGVV